MLPVFLRFDFADTKVFFLGVGMFGVLEAFTENKLNS